MTKTDETIATFDFNIDRDHLTAGLAALPGEVYMAWKAIADARAALETRLRLLKLAEAKKDIEVRSDAAATGQKITENAVAAQISEDIVLQGMREGINDAKYAVDAATATLEAMKCKQQSLSELVQLKCKLFGTDEWNADHPAVIGQPVGKTVGHTDLQEHRHNVDSAKAAGISMMEELRKRASKSTGKVDPTKILRGVKSCGIGCGVATGGITGVSHEPAEVPVN